MPLVDISGAFDLHIHSNPSLFTRTGDDLDMANHAAESGLAGIMLKNHFESTVGRAALADKMTPGVMVTGGLVLNHFTGGVNPHAVETSLSLGARQIWAPTVDSLEHVKVFGHAGGFGYQESGAGIKRSGLTILGGDGELTLQIKQIVELVRDSDAILGSAHLGRDEIFKLALFCRDSGFKKLLITHPYFNPPRLSVPDQKELAGMGAILELCGGNLYPIPGTANIENYTQTISEVGADSLILTSDAGQPRKSLPAEVLRIFGQCLMEKGVGQQEIDAMIKVNPARLLGL